LDLEIFAIGSNCDKIIQYSKKIDKKATPCYELQEAITQIKKLHHKDSIALLSPAASSLDQFSSYIKRGDMFKELVFQQGG